MDYVFKKDESGIKFVGNFNQLYLDQEDPWNQSEDDSDKEMSAYYKNARRTLTDTLSMILDLYDIKNADVAEFGCGLGYVTAQLKSKFPDLSFTGLDISPEAIRRAKGIHGSGINFIESNIVQYNDNLKGKFNIILVVNMLWYILQDLDHMMENILKYFKSSDTNIFILQNAFFKSDQLYGREVIDGFTGAEKYFKDYLSKHRDLDFFHSSFKSGKAWTHDDGIITFGLK
jgi:SAM-dependent methyltransferase